MGMGFLHSTPKIYGQMRVPKGSYHEKQRQEDYITLFAPLLNMGYTLDPVDGRLKIFGPRNLAQETPWCHAKGDPTKHCTLDHNILFNVFNIIPPRCLTCWKICVAPNTFHELLQLEQLEKEMDVPCKCGIEVRDYTPRHYGGYFYTSSLDEGRFRLEQVQDLIKKNIELSDKDKPIKAVLKRGCTEFEFIRGPSPWWTITKEQEDFCKLVEGFVEMDRSNTMHDELVKKHVRSKWFIWAHMNGDKSYVPYNGGHELYPDYVTFNDGSVEDLKRDIAICEAQANGADIDKADELLTTIKNFAKEADVEPRVFNKLIRFDMKSSEIRSIPEQAIGEHNELS